LNFEGITTLHKSNLLRILARLSRENLPNIIVYNLDYEKFEGLVQDNKNWFEKIAKQQWKAVDKEEIDTSYWIKDKSVLFYTRYEFMRKDSNTKEFFHFADVLFGEDQKTFNSINKIVSNTFPNSTFIAKRENEFEINTSYEIPQKLREDYFYNDALLPFDTLLKNGDSKELFLSNLKTFLSNDLIRENTAYSTLSEYILNFDGYHIKNTHFKIGAKLHSEDFYYAKRLFQNSFYTARLAMLIATKIKNEFYEVKTTTKILLVGYEMYSELILSLIHKFLKDNNYNNIKHCVGIDNESEFYFKPNKEEIFWINNQTNLLEKCTVIIIAPIASTGSTAVKIKEAVIKEAEKVVKTELKKSGMSDKELKTAIEKQVELINFSNKPAQNVEKDYVINVIAAQDYKKFASDDGIKNLIEMNNKRQERLIELQANWHLPDKCKYCGLDADNFNDTRALFGTDKSYLTPALIFNKPKGKIVKKTEVETVNIDDISFGYSLRYKSIVRNNEFFLFSVNSPEFIEKNNNTIQTWLGNLNKEFYDNTETLKINSTDRVILLAPCHETNSEFLNLVNELVFNSSATIIHHQIDADYLENFKLLNEKLLSDKTDETIKVFYVDDNLISGKSFFDIYHLFRDTVGEKGKLTGAILLRDSSTQEMHDRFLRAVNHYRAFVAYNLPPLFSFDSKKPLEHERKRYADLRKIALHDVLIKIFDEKEQELNVESSEKMNEAKTLNEIPEDERKKREKEQKTEKEESQNRHWDMFKTTHKVYDFFIQNGITDDVIDELLKHCYNDNWQKTENKITLLKVLSQYPFILYKPLKEKVFEWHKKWLNEKMDVFNKKLNDKTDTSEKSFTAEEYEKFFSFDDFCELKFLIRRAVFLDNLKIVDSSFLKLISNVFINKQWIKKYKPKPDTKESTITEIIREKDLMGNITEKSVEKTGKITIYRQEDNTEYLMQDNLNDFPIFLVRIYLELAHKNGWAAVKLLKNIQELKNKQGQEPNFSTDAAKQFLRMLKIELAAVTNEFYGILTSQYDREWRDVFRDDKELNKKTDNIKSFIDGKKLGKANKYVISKEVLKLDDEIFLKFLWIKQLIHADTHKKSHLPEGINYQDKIDAIIEKMKGFFTKINNIQAFFVVTDAQQNPYVLNDSEYVLRDFEQEYQKYQEYKRLIEKGKKENKDTTQLNDELQQKEKTLIQIQEQSDNEKYRYSEIIKFLKGVEDLQCIASETTAEFKVDKTNKIWLDCYNPQHNNIKLDFLKDENWLYLIRISELEEGEFRTLGLLGFYSTENLYNNPNILLSKQLLMLLRRDMGKFIKKHHKNDEFAALRHAEIAKRFTYLAGHGRQTMQRLAKEDIVFRDVIGTMDKLQYLYATKNLHIKHLDLRDNNNTKKAEEKNQSELMQSFIPIKIKAEDIEGIINTYVKKIYLSKNVENSVEIKMTDEMTNDLNNYDTCGKVNVTIANDFSFNKEILLFIIFEMVINAKKNRWHCIKNNNGRCMSCKNFIHIEVKKDNDKLIIKIETTGTQIGNFIKSDGYKRSIMEAINDGNPIKESSQNEGIYLITKILNQLNNDNEIKMESKEITTSDVDNRTDCTHPCEHQCKLFVNTVTITIKEQKG
jgi:hypothetical protein